MYFFKEFLFPIRSYFERNDYFVKNSGFRRFSYVPKVPYAELTHLGQCEEEQSHLENNHIKKKSTRDDDRERKRLETNSKEPSAAFKGAKCRIIRMSSFTRRLPMASAVLRVIRGPLINHTPRASAFTRSFCILFTFRKRANPHLTPEIQIHLL